MLFNKKIMCVIYCFFSVILILPLSGFNILVERKSQDTIGGEIMVYTVDAGIFREFINNPSQEILAEKNNNVTIQLFSVLNSGKIERKTMKDDAVQVDIGESGIMRIGSLPVYLEFLDFLMYKENLKTILSNNGVYEGIEKYCIIEGLFPYSAKMPISIWIKTVSNNYFLTINESPEDYADDPNSKEFVYRFYNSINYCQKFGLHRGSLIVNGDDITKENYVKFENNTVYLPFRAVLEKLGCKVVWDGINNRAIFSDGSIQYALRINEYPNLVEINNVGMVSCVPPGGGSPFCIVVNGKTIVDKYLMQQITKVLGASIKIDYDRLIVEINK